MRMRIQIQGFDDQKMGKIYSSKKIYIFSIKSCNLLPYPQASIKDVQATGEAFIPQKKTSSTSKREFSALLWVILALMDPDPYSQCGSGSSRPK
jgi:hypothetical protein